jgi:hypothetical protein
LEENVAAPVSKSENTAVGIRHADHVTPLCPQKLTLVSPTSGGRTVVIVRSRTQTTGFSFEFIHHSSNGDAKECEGGQNSFLAFKM